MNVPGGFGSKDVTSNDNVLWVSNWIRNCATVYQIANGRPVTTLPAIWSSGFI